MISSIRNNESEILAKVSILLRGQPQEEKVLFAYELFCEIEENGTSVSTEQFCRRFPDIQSELLDLLTVHQKIQNDPVLLDQFPENDWPVAGQTVCGFELREEIGRGGFSRVFRATDPRRGDINVVLKVGPRALAEGQVLGPIRHDNVMPVEGVYHDDETGYTFLCMPYLGRTTLANIISRLWHEKEIHRDAKAIWHLCRDAHTLETMTAVHPIFRHGTYVDAVVYIAMKICDALEFLHARQLNHADLKPGNIVFESNGNPRLIDFNLATNWQKNSPQFGGTLLYMAPEQLQSSLDPFQSSEQRIDATADCYAFGIILYELLTGVNPFRDCLSETTEQSTVGILQAQKAGVTLKSTANLNIPTSLCNLVNQCLCYDKHDRPQEIAYVRQVLARQLTVSNRIYKWCRQNVVQLVGTATFLFLFTINSIITWANTPKVAQIHGRKGAEAFLSKDFKKASKQFELVYNLEPDNTKNRLALLMAKISDLGLVTNEKVDLEHEWTQIEKELIELQHLPLSRKSKDDSFWLDVCHAQAALAQKQFARAKMSFDKIVNSSKCFPEVQINAAFVYLQRNQMQAADYLIDQLLQSESDQPHPYLLKALSLERHSVDVAVKVRIRDLEQTCIDLMRSRNAMIGWNNVSLVPHVDYYKNWQFAGLQQSLRYSVMALERQNEDIIISKYIAFLAAELEKRTHHANIDAPIDANKAHNHRDIVPRNAPLANPSELATVCIVNPFSSYFDSHGYRD